MRRDLLILTVFFLLIVNIWTSVYLISETESRLAVPTARMTQQGQIEFCINGRPVINNTCSGSMSQDTPYTCQINATDAEGANLTFTQLIQPPQNTTIFNLSSSGLINFTPSNNDTGNYSTLIIVDDGTICSNSNASALFNFSIGNFNDPPYLSLAIPDQNFTVNTTLVGFFLTDHFTDPDDDAMTFTYSTGLATVTINVTINPDSSVQFTSNQCGYAFLQFTATDPFNESATSNVVEVTSICPPDSTPPTPSGSGGGGGGGGGGGFSFPCESEMICLPWSDCYPNGMQRQVCNDKNGCVQDEVVFDRNCTYIGEQPTCEENWLCDEWGPCRSDETQERTCEDLNLCGSTQFQPVLERVCNYIPSCFDGVQNGNETGVDCGGQCKACTEIQEPSAITAASRTAVIMTMLLILLLIILLALFTMYREKVYESMAELGWYFARKRPKELLLSQQEKELLFSFLKRIDAAIVERTITPDTAYEQLSIAIRTFYSFVFNIPFEFTNEEYHTALEKAELHAETHNLLANFSRLLVYLESGKLGPQVFQHYFYGMKEEFRLLVCMYSKYGIAEVERDLPERLVDESLSFIEEIKRRLLNTYEALQFMKVEQAKEEYLKLLRAYEQLPEREKALVFHSVQRIYLEVKYAEETVKE